jgi:hypothetical protein
MRRHEANDGHHRTPLFWQVAPILVEFGHVSRVSRKISQRQGRVWDRIHLIKLRAWTQISRAPSVDKVAENRPSA